MSYNDDTKYSHEDPLLYLDIYHHSIAVQSNESGVLQKLKDEFHFFVTEKTQTPHSLIEIHLAPAPEMPSLLAVKILDSANIYRMGSRQYVDYFGEALIIRDDVEKTVRIYSESSERLFELSFLTIHSLLGQELDKRGLCRLHALAVSIHNVNAIVMLPSKGGKSTLLRHLLDNPEVRIISDDMPLINLQGKVLSFPSKIGLDQRPENGPLAALEWHEFKRYHWPTKWTASLSQMKERLNPSPENNQNLLIAGYRLSQGQSVLTEVSRWKMIRPLMEHMIIGLGLPQIIELFLKFQFTDFFTMIHHGFMRSLSAFQLARKSRCYHFYMGPDRAYNAQLLLDLIYEHQTT